MIPAAYETDSPAIQGVKLLGILVGLLAAELVCSGHLSDKIMIILTRKNGGRRLPEMRLWLGMPAAILSSIGLLVWGLSVDREWRWIVGQVGLFFCKLIQTLAY